MHFYIVIIDNATIEEEMENDGAMYVKLNVRGKSSLELVRNYFSNDIIIQYRQKYKYVDTVTVYLNHSKKNIAFRRTTVVNLIP